jgi:hypothetical protein
VRQLIALFPRPSVLATLKIDENIHTDAFVEGDRAGDGAIISVDGKYRYLLWRTWDPSLPKVVWVMLNPSTADHRMDDPTIRKCIKFSKAWGFGRLEVVNLFPYRATDPAELKKLSYFEALGPAYAERFIWDAAAEAKLVVAAWGQNGKLHGQDTQVWLEGMSKGIQFHALKLAKNGTPYHPLYLKDDTKPFLWRA